MDPQPTATRTEICHNHMNLEKTTSLAGVAQLVGALSHPVPEKTTSLR